MPGHLYIKFFDEVNRNDVGEVGGKVANLGDMYQGIGIPIPFGFAVTSKAFDRILDYNKGLRQYIQQELAKVDVLNISQLKETGAKIRQKLKNAKIPDDLRNEVIEAYDSLSKHYREKNVHVAVRSSATAEDLPDASFAGLQKTVLNVASPEELLKAMMECEASLYNNESIQYRKDKKFDETRVKLSVGVQKMVKPDAAGAMFTIDPATGNSRFYLINANWGQGESVVSGGVNPDQILIFNKNYYVVDAKVGKKEKMVLCEKDGGIRYVKPPEQMRKSLCLSEEHIKKLGELATIIKQHYGGKHQDIEWAIEGAKVTKDGKIKGGTVYIVQSRAETVHSRKGTIEEIWKLDEPEDVLKENLILTGTPGCEKIGVGKPHVILKIAEQHLFKEKEVLVLPTATPAHDPLMRISSATVTDKGGVTCHAAIVGREMGKPVIVGTVKATKILGQYDKITIDGTTGKIYKGELKYKVKRWDTSKISTDPYKIMINVGKAEEARKHGEKAQGIGLMRIELIYAGFGWHPLFLKHYNEFVQSYEDAKNKGEKTFEFFDQKVRLSKAEKLITELEKVTPGYKDKVKALKDILSHEMAAAAMAVYPYDAIIRFSDFKSNEYRELKGGEFFETVESNPMQGFRGARRYVSKSFKDVFKKTEVEAARDAIFVKGADNIKMMIPIVSQVSEVVKLQKLMDKVFPEHRGLKGMFEVPVNALMAKEFASVLEYGFSIGSNDFTSGVLMIDRDSEIKDVSKIFNEHTPGVERGILMGIEGVHMNNPPRDIGICGEGPSNNPPFRKFLVRAGIDSISVNPDVIGKVKKAVAKEVKQLRKTIEECDYNPKELAHALSTQEVQISEFTAEWLIKKLSTPKEV